MVMKKSVRSLFQAVVLLAAVFFLVVGFGYFQYGIDAPRVLSLGLGSKGKNDTTQASSSQRQGNDTLFSEAPPYITAIMNSGDATFPRLECPFSNPDRYRYLREMHVSSRTTPRRKYFFALDLYQCRYVLPRLIGSIVEAMRFLGPENCALSIVEGRSSDGTFEVLKQLESNIAELGSRYILQSSEIDPSANSSDRIRALAELRNLAVQDLVDHPEQYSSNTTVIFLNDVAPCMEDILEIIHQRVFQSADMTCAMDWTYVGEHPTFYDVWIARGMTGDTFFNIPSDGSWDYAWNLFWNDDKAHARWSSSKPFQVFSCWNGLNAFTAEPLMNKKIKFREHYDTECHQGEPKLFAKDMWFHGYGKIAVVPSANIEYSDEASKKIKALKGYVSSHVANEGDDIHIEWESEPPAKVKCIPGSYSEQKFVDWDEGLPKRLPTG